MNKFITLKSLKDYKNEELLIYLNENETIDIKCLCGILSEILRRMNGIKPLLSKEVESDWGNPLIP